MYNVASINVLTVVGAGGVPQDPDPIVIPASRVRSRCFRIMDMGASFNCLLGTNNHPTQQSNVELFSIDIPYTTSLSEDMSGYELINLDRLQWRQNIPATEVQVLMNYYSPGWYYARVLRADPNTTISFIPATGMDRRAG